MKKILLFILLLCTLKPASGQEIKVSGAVADNETKQGIPGANILIKGKLTGTVTNGSGEFELRTSVKPPFILVVSVIGYQKQEVEVADSGTPLTISLSPSIEIMDEMVFSASRMEENILQSPVTIEKMSIRDIQETSSVNFYDALQN